MHQANIYTSLLQAFEIFTWPCTSVMTVNKVLDIDRHITFLWSKLFDNYCWRWSLCSSTDLITMQKNALKQFNAMKYLRSITASLGCHSSLSHVVTINFNYQTYRTSAAVPNYLRTRDNRSVRIIIKIIIHNHNRNQNHSFHHFLQAAVWWWRNWNWNGIGTGTVAGEGIFIIII